MGEPPRRRLEFLLSDSYTLVVRAALAGQSICLAWAGILDDFLESGLLVRVSPLAATSDRCHFITSDQQLAERAPTRAIARWLVARAKP
ncbi:MAG TPA: hypothetical protein VN812_14295 [Candidatus Acidoferrales bacterium]|nr:hypothetical protein [Candidatus Acidoferrales bacterium]